MTYGFRRRFRTLASIGLAMLACSAAIAEDTLKLKDGRTLTGRVISDDGATVVFETRHRGMRLKGNYPRTAVESLVRDEATGPTYYALPLIGSIGRQNTKDAFVSGELFRNALAEVRKQKPDYVVLVIDSPGGSLEDMHQIIEAMGEAKDVRFVAYVKRAISAAAIIALRCPTVCMASDGTMGGAVPFKMGPDGTPQVIEEKFQSILRAEFRRAAELGGHSPLIAQAMMDVDLELLVTTRDGKPEVIEPTNGVDGTPLKRRGRILTLTADEAKSCGVSIGTAATIEGIAPLLGKESWRSLDDKAWFQMVNAADAQKEHEERKLAHTDKMKSWAKTVDGLQQEMEKLEQRFNSTLARREAEVKAGTEISTKANDEIAELKAQWEAERVAVAGSTSTNGALNASTKRRLADLDANYESRQKVILERVNPELDAAKAKVKTTDEELTKLQEQMKAVRAKVPVKPKQVK